MDTMTLIEIETSLESYIRSAFSVSPSDPRFARDVDLLAGGYVDSIGYVELLEFIADTYGVEIPEDDAMSDEFATIDGIAAIIGRLVEARQTQRS